MQRTLPPSAIDDINRSIADIERRHPGEICFVVETRLSIDALAAKTTPRERALELFAQLRVWDTEHNNGVLLYLLLADHAAEIVADRAAAKLASQSEWDAICQNLLPPYFQRGDAFAGVSAVVTAIAEILSRDSTTRPRKLEQLPNTVRIER
jgi:uncharacterized membrane protein